MSKNILIRDLSGFHQKKLEQLKDHFRESTNSKTCLYIIQTYMEKEEKIYDLNEEIQQLRKENSLLKGFKSNIEYELSLLDSCSSD